MGRISRSEGTQKTRNQMDTDDLTSQKQRCVGLLYDDRMCKHYDSKDHVENPSRILSIWNKLQSSGINLRCVVLNAKEAEDRHIALVHGKKHIDLIKSISSPSHGLRRNKVANRYNDIYFNEGSSEAACLAAGSVVEVAEKVAKGELDSGFAIVRPPGHHAEANEPMGFCLLNNVAIAASYVLNERQELGIGKILIVDWDVHHGNATQEMFWKDPRVLVFSVHRHENGAFYPFGDAGSYLKTGEGPGAGYNINVPWENDGCGDVDYLAAWDHVLIPVAKAFNPDLIIVSAGFDAAINDPLGGCCVTPYGFSMMLSRLMELAQGKIVMALEGGYNLESLASSSLACVETLLDEKPVNGSLRGYPLESTWRVILAVRKQLKQIWPILANQLPLVESVAAPDSISQDLAAATDHVLQPLMNLRVDTSSSLKTPPGGSSSSALSTVVEDFPLQVKALEAELTRLNQELVEKEALLKTLKRKADDRALEVKALQAKVARLDHENDALKKGEFWTPSMQHEFSTVFVDKILKSKTFEKFLLNIFELSEEAHLHDMATALKPHVREDKRGLLDKYISPRAAYRLEAAWHEARNGGVHFPFVEYYASLNKVLTPDELRAITFDESETWKKPPPEITDGSSATDRFIYYWHKAIQDGFRFPFLDHIKSLNRLVTAEEIAAYEEPPQFTDDAVEP